MQNTVQIHKGTKNASVFMEFSREGYWSVFLCCPPGDLPNPGIEPECPALAD